MMTELMLVEGVSDVQLISITCKMFICGNMRKVMIWELRLWINRIT